MRTDEALFREFVRETTAGRPLSRAIAAWATEALRPAASRRAERDRLLREAAELLPGSTWSKARALHAEVKAVRQHIPVAPDLSTVRGRVAAALLVYPGKPDRPLSAHQIFRAIERCIGPVEMQRRAVGT